MFSACVPEVIATADQMTCSAIFSKVMDFSRLNIALNVSDHVKCTTQQKLRSSSERQPYRLTMKAAYDNPNLHFLLGVAVYQHAWGGVQGWMDKKISTGL